jgi:hypothetical protein
VIAWRMGDERSPSHGPWDLLVAYDDRHGRAGRIPFSDPAQAAAALKTHARAWLGDIFFDHVRGVLDPEPAPLVAEPPFLVVFWLRDFELSVSSCTITPYGDAPSAITAAQEIVEQQQGDAAAWDVYCVRVTQVS